MRKYWTPINVVDSKKAKTFSELAKIALRIIERMPQPVEMVCGPLTSGGLGSFKKNTEVLKRHILKLSRGAVVFNQLPFEPHLHRILNSPYHKGGNHLLREFYGKIFKSGSIKTLHFIPGWKTSFGARWERKTAKRLGIKIEDIK